jgi:hypothetical protein
MSLHEEASNRSNDDTMVNEAEDTISPNIGLQLVKKVLKSSLIYSYLDRWNSKSSTAAVYYL